jgi:secretion/DNA translocation related TadE-like protein
MSDRGNATIWVLAFGMLAGLVAIVCTLQGVATVARHRAEIAADLSALSAAAELAGNGAACTIAARVAQENGAELRRCTADGSVIEVEVCRRMSLGRLGGWVAVARARAGPAGEALHSTTESGAVEWA